MTTLHVHGPARIHGRTTVPGDKSIAHRALMVAAAAAGRSTIEGLPSGEDVAATARCVAGFGVRVERDGDRATVVSDGVSAWREPAHPLDCGNSGTTMRVLAGLAARRGFETVLDGDPSLRRRPMERVAGPLRALGASVETRDGRPPVRITGGALLGRRIDIDVASAQVKSCLVLAGLGARGVTTVTEPYRSRDHTERMLDALGVPIRFDDLPDGRRIVEVMEAELPPVELCVPGDPSSAAFLVAAAFLAGDVRIDGVCLNPTRVGFLEIASRMGGTVRWETTSDELGEPLGWIEASRSALNGVGIEGPDYPVVQDELPLVAVLATQASGPTHVMGAGELRLKETDRIAAMRDGLLAMGASFEDRPDGFVVTGPTPLHGADVDARGDHRIAMAFAVAALAAEGTTRVGGWEAARVSWPGFEERLRALGAELEVR